VFRSDTTSSVLTGWRLINVIFPPIVPVSFTTTNPATAESSSRTASIEASWKFSRMPSPGWRTAPAAVAC
jgi:hypothetical protein